MRFLLLGWVMVMSVLSAFSQQAEPLIFAEKIHGFGDVEENGGPVTYDFTFTNNAGRPVKIINVQASCGCTTPDWTREAIPNGKTGFIRAVFHPFGKPGYFNKSLTVITDLGSSSINLQIKGQVIANVRKPEDVFDAESGNLRLKSNSFNVGRAYINQNPVVAEFDMYNGGKKTIHFKEKPLTPSYIKVQVPDSLLSQKSAKIKITYNAKAKNEYGFVSDNIELITDDELHPRKSFSVYATIEEFFPTLTAAESSNAPLLQPEFALVDLGRAQGGSELSGQVRIRNAGKKELIIHALQPNCLCVSAEADKMKLKPGEETKIAITFNGKGRTGTHQKALTIYSNDPHNPVQRITVMAYLEESN